MLGVRPEWLVDGKEPKLNDRSKRAGEQVFSGLPLSPEMRGSEKKRIPIAENAVLYGREPRMIPVLSWAQAGMAADFEEIPIDWQETIPSTVGDRNAVAIMLRGDSMEPKHSEGDIAVVMPTTAARHGDLVIAKIKEEGLVFKIFNLIGGDPRRIRLSSYNPAYSPNEYGREDFHFIFPVHSVTRLTRR
jgi:SOS-response transcriptional repressor LexA